MQKAIVEKESAPKVPVPKARASGRTRRRPLHLFTYEGQRYFFDSASSIYAAVDELAYDVLKESRKFDLSDRSRVTKKLSDKYAVEQIDAALAEVGALKEAGLFEMEPPEIEEEIEQDLRDMVRKKSVNFTISVAQACNLACTYCYGDCGTFGMAPQLMSQETARKAVDLAFQRAGGIGEVNITFFGGEPLLNFPVIEDAVHYSQRLGQKWGKDVAYSITTNGTLLNDEIIDFLCDWRFSVMVSLDGPPELQDDQRPFKDGRGSFEVIAPKLRRLREKRGGLTVRPTLTSNKIHTQQVSDFLDEMGFTRIQFGWAAGTCFHKDMLDLTFGDLKELHKQEVAAAERILDQLEAGEHVAYNPFVEFLENIHGQKKIKMRCGLARGNSTVAADGQIFPCHRYVGMEAYAIGDVETGIDPERAYQVVADYNRVRQFCTRTCWAHNVCGGPCPQYVAHPDGRHLEPDNQHCYFQRKSLEFGIWFYVELNTRFPDYLKRVVGEGCG